MKKFGVRNLMNAESNKNDFIQNLGEIRNINLNNKKIYTFFYNELEDQIDEHLELTDTHKNSKNNLLEQKTIINSVSNKIRGLTYSIENLFLEYTSTLPRDIILENYNKEINYSFDLIKDTEILIEKFKELCKGLSPELKSKDGGNIILRPLESFVVQTIERLKTVNEEIIKNLDKNFKTLNSIKNSLNEEIKIEKDRFDIDYQTRFKEETTLILKRFENEISNLTKKYENQFKILKLDNDKIIKSHNLLNDGVDSALKSLANLNERTQIIELEYSKIIGNETQKIKLELEETKSQIADQIDSIITNVKAKSHAIEIAHSDFKNLVEKAGIYELTKNYEKKGNEEKKEYKDYRLYTSISIILAIISTIGIFAFAFWEQSQIPSGKIAETNYLLLISRLSISLMFFVLALYLSKQASKHYECYQENHRTFLQLAALEPFMARMTPDEQKEIRKGLIPSYFNQTSDGKYSSKGDEVDLSSNMTTIFTNLIDKIPSKKEQENSIRSENTTG
ncbi:UNVERIFIED_CONTAM: hypothetical protein KWE62_15990 [Acinetobacter baumannii]|nr:hypothetical protein [Acinetobacter baumannii]HAV4234306.1 hypothetical protein [Acinetobacter baumannii ATCC 17978]EKU3412413.1 hypothetical protein [Acinetobacter baumannii]EMC1590891.1 hypothetical protein [Acinetobacter baumannii]MBD0542163.1 hypothetical protein [Acinetobacter baumannii]